MSDAAALGQVFGDLIGAAMFTVSAISLAIFAGAGLWCALAWWLAGGQDDA